MSRSTESKPLLPIAPGVLNPTQWRFVSPPRAEWERTRKIVLKRDDHTCRYCGHRALKHMHVHHRYRGDVHVPRNLVTCCVACHAILHVGLNLQLRAVEIWKSELSQLQIVRKTRRLVKQGVPLQQIKKHLKLKRGELPCKSVEYANLLISWGGAAKRISMPDPYRAVFVKFKMWQIEREV